MKKTKSYIQPDLAKKKIARYKYWLIKDESGITITSSNDENETRSFAEILDAIIADNVDAEIQVRFGTSDSSSRQNTPIFIRINEAIEWVEPAEDETVNINGVPHKVDKNGNVNINFTTPKNDDTIHEANPVDSFRHEMEVQLEGLRQENKLQAERFQQEMHNKLHEQTLQFKGLMLDDREARIKEREEALAIKEQELQEKENEMTDDVKGYIKHIPSALGGLVKGWLKDTGTKQALGQTKQEKPIRNKVEFEIQDHADDHSEVPQEHQTLELDTQTEVEPQNQDTEDEHIQD